VAKSPRCSSFICWWLAFVGGGWWCVGECVCETIGDRMVVCVGGGGGVDGWICVCGVPPAECRINQPTPTHPPNPSIRPNTPLKTTGVVYACMNECIYVCTYVCYVFYLPRAPVFGRRLRGRRCPGSGTRRPPPVVYVWVCFVLFTSCGVGSRLVFSCVCLFTSCRVM
jgi:hypothetical protein